jgi:hypothetical protein
MVALTGGRTACIREWRCSTSVGHVWRTCGIATRRGRSRRAIGTSCFHTTNTCLGGTSRVFVSPFGTEFIMGQNNRRTEEPKNRRTEEPKNRRTEEPNNQTIKQPNNQTIKGLHKKEETKTNMSIRKKVGGIPHHHDFLW